VTETKELLFYIITRDRDRQKRENQQSSK